MGNNRLNISVIIITRNEEHNIVDCLESVKWSDDIVIVDAQSTDRTVDLAKKYSPKIFVTSWLGYAAAKQFALEKVSNEWVLWLDADERVTPELAEELHEIVRLKDDIYSGYEVARKAYFLGRWIKHCGWYPGYVLRFFKKGKVKFNTARVHEKIEYAGAIGRLKNHLIHYTDDNLYHYFSKFNHYTTLAAQDVRESGKKYSLYDVLVRPPFLFLKMYILRFGFLDGMQGLILSMLSAAYVFTKYVKLWELEHSKHVRDNMTKDNTT
jgi:glycosyltransferase involved in cell wall biosynthesis